MSVRNWPTLTAKTAVAASLLAAAAACSSSGSSSPPAAGGATSTAPLSTAALVTGSKQEKGLLIYSNALSSQMQEVTKAFQAKYPWIHVSVTDDEDPVVFSKYAAQHAAGVRTADLLIASAPGLWVGAAANGFLQPFTPAGIANYPAFTSQGKGLYIFSPDPAITIYNKVVLKGQPAPSTVAQIAQDGIDKKYKVATYAINNSFGYSVFWGYAHQQGGGGLDKLGQSA